MRRGLGQVHAGVEAELGLCCAKWQKGSSKNQKLGKARKNKLFPSRYVRMEQLPQEAKHEGEVAQPASLPHILI